MKTLILYPSDYFNLKKVDESFEEEYNEAGKFSSFEIGFFDYDSLVSDEKIRFYPAAFEAALCVYRGWMLKPKQYETLYKALKAKGIFMINTPKEYRNCHQFPNCYGLLCDVTPKISVFQPGENVDWKKVKINYERFMIKDYVKSVKGTNFPAYFDSGIADSKLDDYIKQFKELRGHLLDGGIVIKEFVDLARVNGVTNEYRAFILKGQILCLAPNSNQQNSRPIVPSSLILRTLCLPSQYYTVDYAQVSDGSWIVIETGDGQVSGLPSNQLIYEYYKNLEYILDRS